MSAADHAVRVFLLGLTVASVTSLAAHISGRRWICRSCAAFWVGLLVGSVVLLAGGAVEYVWWTGPWAWFISKVAHRDGPVV